MKTYTPKWFYIYESPVGLLYVGQTVRKKLKGYYGSGLDWTPHISTYGKPTLVFSKWCNTPQEFQELLDALLVDHTDYYLESNTKWANKIPETPWDGTRPMLGRKHTQETRNRISAANYRNSKTVRARMLGSGNPMYGKPSSKRKGIICHSLGLYFYDKVEAATYFGYTVSGIRNMLTGRQKNVLNISFA